MRTVVFLAPLWGFLRLPWRQPSGCPMALARDVLRPQAAGGISMEVRRASVSCPAAPVPAHQQGVPPRRRERPDGFVQGRAGPVAREISGVQAQRPPVLMQQALPPRDAAPEALQAARESHLGKQGAQRKWESWELTALRQVLPPHELSDFLRQAPPQVSPSSEALVQQPEKQEILPAAWAQPRGAPCQQARFPVPAFHGEAEARVQPVSPARKGLRQGGRVLPWRRRRRPSRRLRRLWRGRGSACGRVRRARYQPNSNGSSFR